MNKHLLLLVALAPALGLASSSSSSSSAAPKKQVRFLLNGKPGIAQQYEAPTVPPTIDSARLLMAMSRPGKKSFAERTMPLLREAEQRCELVPGTIFTPAVTNKILHYLTYRDLSRIFPVSKQITSAMNHPGLIMPKGTAWVAWANELLNSDQSPELIFNTIISAGGRSPNACEALSKIKHCYFANVPDELQLFDIDAHGVVHAAAKDKREALGQLFDRLRKDPTCEEDRQAHAKLLGELMPKLKISLPYTLAATIASLGGNGIDVLTAKNDKGCEQKLMDRCGPSYVYEYCLFNRLLYSCLPAMHQCLANVPANAERKAKIEAAISSITYGFPQTLEPCALTFKAEDEVIEHLKKIIWTMRQISKGKLLSHHNISKEMLLAVRKQAENELQRFLGERENSITYSRIPKVGKNRASFFAREAELLATLMECGFHADSEFLTHKLIAANYIYASNSGGITKKISAAYFLKGLGHARRALTLTRGETSASWVKAAIEKLLKRKTGKYGPETEAGKALRTFMTDFDIRDAIVVPAIVPRPAVIVEPGMSDAVAGNDYIIAISSDDSDDTHDMVDELHEVIMIDSDNEAKEKE